MYWFKKYLSLALLPGLLAIISCKSGSTTGTTKFFDLKAYFKSEAARLAKSNPLITKTAIHNGESEKLKERIKNWDSELNLFADADINKPAWSMRYKVDSSGSFLIYKANDPKLKTQDIIIKRENGKIKWILIHNYTKSTILGKTLYETIEKLSYFPDSLYQIQKKQYTRTLGYDIYSVKGAFN
jgi:hypothetical protein